MALQNWPAGVRGNDGQILRAGLEDLPGDNLLRSQMDDGFKQRRQFTRGLSRFKASIKMPRSEYNLFTEWVRDTLKEGQLGFSFYHPIRDYSVAANFVAQDGRAFIPQPAPAGWMIVTFELDYIDRALA